MAGAGDRPDTMPSQWFLTKGRCEFVFTWLDHSCLYPGTIVMRKHGRHTHIDYNVCTHVCKYRTLYINPKDLIHNNTSEGSFSEIQAKYQPSNFDVFVFNDIYM